jgi:hypothetical protein
MEKRLISSKTIGYQDSMGTKFGALKERQPRFGSKIYLFQTQKSGIGILLIEYSITLKLNRSFKSLLMGLSDRMNFLGL